MIDLQIGKAIIAVEIDTEFGNPCGQCCFEIFAMSGSCIFDCGANKRRDGKNVVYKTIEVRLKKNLKLLEIEGDKNESS